MAPLQIQMECTYWRLLKKEFCSEWILLCWLSPSLCRMQYLLESSTWVERKPSREDCKKSAHRSACKGFVTFTNDYKIDGCRQWNWMCLTPFPFLIFTYLIDCSFPWDVIAWEVLFPVYFKSCQHIISAIIACHYWVHLKYHLKFCHLQRCS